jgi:hypothetical protein
MIPPTPTENLFTTPLTLFNPSFSPPVKKLSLIYASPFLSFCSDKYEIVHVSMFEVIFDRNGAKVYVRNLRVLSRRKSAKRGFLKSSSHSSTETRTADPRAFHSALLMRSHFDKNKPVKKEF